MSLFEQVSPTVRYAKAPTAIGVVTHGERALVVDSGLDENLVRKVINALANEGVSVAAIVNTHSHADHCGGNAFAQKRTNARVVAPAMEHYFIERPDLEPWTLFGAPAHTGLQGKFLQAAPSRVDEVVADAGTRDVAGFDVRFRALPGHSAHQMGVEVDGVLFVGDALLPPHVMEKYGLLFAVDPRAAADSARRLLDADDAPAHVVAYHGGLIDDIPAAVKRHVEVTEAVERALLDALARGPSSDEDLLVQVLDVFPPANAGVELHALQHATVRAYLSAMERAGVVEARVEKHRLLWALRDG